MAAAMQQPAQHALHHTMALKASENGLPMQGLLPEGKAPHFLARHRVKGRAPKHSCLLDF